MTSPGRILGAARAAQGRQLAHISRDLCITQGYLRAIEADDLVNLPGTFFYKSFVKQYATLLGVDDAKFLAAVDHLVQAAQPEENPQAPASPNPDFVWAPTERKHLGPLRVPDPIVEAANKLDLSHRSLAVSLAGLVLALVGGSGFYAWWSEASPVDPTIIPASNGTQSGINDQASDSSQILPSVSTPSGSPYDGSSGFTTSSAAPGLDILTTTGEDGLRRVVLNLSAKEQTWISISSEGKQIFSGILQPSETKTLTGVEAARMRVGNAGGIDVQLNGRPIGPLGESGQVRVVEFTPDDFEILKPQPAQPQPEADSEAL